MSASTVPRHDASDRRVMSAARPAITTAPSISTGLASGGIASRQGAWSVVQRAMPSSQPASHARASGASGSRNCQLTCTAPPCAPAWPHARAKASSTVDSTNSGEISVVGHGRSADHRAAPARRFACGIAWFAPQSRSSGGRSAAKTSSGVRVIRASTTAGSALATAVPLVITATAGTPVDFAMPSARNAPPRSSCATCTRIPACRPNATASGALRDPGETTACRTPSRKHSSAASIVQARLMLGASRMRKRYQVAKRSNPSSLWPVSRHSSAGSEPSTMPAPAYAVSASPSMRAERIATAISAPSRLTTPTGPA